MDLERLTGEVNSFTIDTINHLKSLRLKIEAADAALQTEIDGLESSLATTPGGVILTAAPTQGIGGSNSAGAGPALIYSNHDHLIREPSGPTDLSVGDIADVDVLRRVGSAIVGRQIQATRSTGGANTTTSTTPSDVDAAQLMFSLKANADYLVYWLVFYTTAATTTGIMLGMNYTAALTSIRYANFGATGLAALSCSVGTTNNASLGQAGVGPGATERVSFLVGYVRTSAAGTLTLRYASGVAGSAVNVQPSTHGLILQ